MSQYHGVRYPVSAVAADNLVDDAAAKRGLNDEANSHSTLILRGTWDRQSHGAAIWARQQEVDMSSTGAFWVQEAGIQPYERPISDYVGSAQTSHGDLPPGITTQPETDIFELLDGGHLGSLEPAAPVDHYEQTSYTEGPILGTLAQRPGVYTSSLPAVHPGGIYQWLEQSSSATTYGGSLPLVASAGPSPYIRRISDDLDTPHKAPARLVAPTVYESSSGLSPTMRHARYYNAGHSHIPESLPHGVTDEGTGTSDAVVGEAAHHPASTNPSTHEHPKGKKKKGVKRKLVHDCKDNGRVLPGGLERHSSGVIKLLPLYKLLSGPTKLPTETFDRLIFPPEEAHGVDKEGNYICRARTKVVRAGNQQHTWEYGSRPCNTVLEDKAAQRRHVLEQHLALSLRKMKHDDKTNAKYIPLETRIEMRIAEMEKYEMVEGEGTMS